MKSQLAAGALVAVLCLSFEVRLVHSQDQGQPGRSCTPANAPTECRTTTTFLQCNADSECQCDPNTAFWDGNARCVLKSGADCNNPAPAGISCQAFSSCVDIAGARTCECNYGRLPAADNSRVCNREIAPSTINGPCTLYPTGVNTERVCLAEKARCVNNICSCIEGWKADTGNTACNVVDFRDARIGGNCAEEPAVPTDFECVIERATCIAEGSTGTCTCNEGWDANEDNTACDVVIAQPATLGGECTPIPTVPTHFECRITNAECVGTAPAPTRCTCKSGWAPNPTNDACTPVFKDVLIGEGCIPNNELANPGDRRCNIDKATCDKTVCTCNNGWGPNPGNTACSVLTPGQAKLGGACEPEPTLPTHFECSITNATCGEDKKCNCQSGFSKLEGAGIPTGLEICFNSAGMLLISGALLLAQQAFFFIKNQY